MHCLSRSLKQRTIMNGNKLILLYLISWYIQMCHFTMGNNGFETTYPLAIWTPDEYNTVCNIDLLRPKIDPSWPNSLQRLIHDCIGDTSRRPSMHSVWKFYTKIRDHAIYWREARYTIATTTFDGFYQYCHWTYLLFVNINMLSTLYLPI